jgi:hypothetical protein
MKNLQNLHLDLVQWWSKESILMFSLLETDTAQPQTLVSDSTY